VVDVPAKLAARVRVFSQGHGRKTDRDDAYSIGLAALGGAGVLELRADDALVALRLLCDRREELVAARPRSVCRLHRLLCELTPGGLSRELSAGKGASVLARIRPRDEVGKIGRALAAQHLADIRALDRQLTAVRTQIAELVEHNGTGLTGPFGVGPVIAGRIVPEVGDVSRFASSDHFASDNGTAPIDVSSGEQVRHRFSRAGNRRTEGRSSELAELRDLLAATRLLSGNGAGGGGKTRLTLHLAAHRPPTLSIGQVLSWLSSLDHGAAYIVSFVAHVPFRFGVR
jgi:transposase